MAKKLTEIVWMDAVGGETKIDDERSPEEYLCKTTTYGEVYKENKKAVIIRTSYNDLGDVEYVAIPKKWIEKRSEYEEV